MCKKILSSIRRKRNFEGIAIYVLISFGHITKTIITSMAAGHYFIALLRLGQLNDSCVNVLRAFNFERKFSKNEVHCVLLVEKRP